MTAPTHRGVSPENHIVGLIISRADGRSQDLG
jgi:hypothetical protein